MKRLAGDRWFDTGGGSVVICGVEGFPELGHATAERAAVPYSHCSCGEK